MITVEFEPTGCPKCGSINHKRKSSHFYLYQDDIPISTVVPQKPRILRGFMLKEITCVCGMKYRLLAIPTTKHKAKENTHGFKHKGKSIINPIPYSLLAELQKGTRIENQVRCPICGVVPFGGRICKRKVRIDDCTVEREYCCNNIYSNTTLKGCGKFKVRSKG